MELSRDQIIKYIKLRLLQNKKETVNEHILESLPYDVSDTLHRKATFLYIFSNSFTVVSATRKIGINRDTYYHWYNTDPAFKEMVEEVKEMKIDFFEDAMIKCIREKGIGYSRLIEFALKTIGKSRGYTEEVTSYDDDIIEFTINPGKKLLKPKEEDNEES